MTPEFSRTLALARNVLQLDRVTVESLIALGTVEALTAWLAEHSDTVRSNPYHDSKTGKFTSHGGGGTLATGTRLADLSPEGRAAVAANNAKYGLTSATLESELESKLTPETIAQGKKWFPEARAFNESLAKRSGLSVEQTTAITALTSPRTPWPQNKRLAERVALTHGKYTDADPIVAAKHMGGSLSANLGPAIAVARGGDIDSHMTGIKRRSFYNNMLKPGATNDVTVDTWMQRTAMKAASKPMSLEQSRQYLQAAHGAGYVSIAEATRAVAAKHGLSPDEVQAAYWTGISGSKEGNRPGKG